MSPYRGIVCPVDFSELSKTALRWSLELTEKFDGTLTVLHAVDTPSIASETLFAAPESAAELRVRAQEEFHALGREVDLSRARLEIVEGVPAEAIASYAHRNESDLVIMGTHGWSGVQRLLLGSVTEKVLHRIEAPLLTLSADAAGSARFSTILVAVDLGHDSDSQTVMRHGLWLAEASAARLVVAHIVPVPYIVLNDRTLERLSPADYAELEKNLTEDRRAKIVDLLPESTGVDVEIVTKVGNVFESLEEMAKDKTADLVVMGAGGHGRSALRWLGSTCHKMVRLGACPVLIAR